MDSVWSSRRRAYVRTGFVSVVVLAISVVALVVWYEPPTCFDGKKNQDELGVDCGGQCTIFCAEQMQSLKVNWTKTFNISPQVWSAVTLVEHSNFGAQSGLIPYKFTFYDYEGKPIGERTGETFFNSDDKRVFPIIEPKLDFGERTPYRTMFEWLDAPKWQKYTPIIDGVQVEEREIIKLNYGLEIRAWLANERPFPLSTVDVAVVVLDKENNAIAVSTTFVEYVAPRGGVPLSFSWPHDFTERPTRTEFYYRTRGIR